MASHGTALTLRSWLLLSMQLARLFPPLRPFLRSKHASWFVVAPACYVKVKDCKVLVACFAKVKQTQGAALCFARVNEKQGGERTRTCASGWRRTAEDLRSGQLQTGRHRFGPGLQRTQDACAMCLYYHSSLSCGLRPRGMWHC